MEEIWKVVKFKEDSSDIACIKNDIKKNVRCRGVLKRKITLLLDKVQVYDDQVYKEIKELLHDIAELDKTIMELFENGGLYEGNQLADTHSDEVAQYHCNIMEKLFKLEKMNGSTVKTVDIPPVATGARLPVIECPSFSGESGDPLEYVRFKEIFFYGM